MRSTLHVLLFSAGTLLWTGCCSCATTPKSAALTGAFVVAGGPVRTGIAGKPTLDGPLAVAGADCRPRSDFDHLGPPCNVHEPESAASADMSGALTPGAHPTTDETAWFCEGSTVLRLVLERCGTNTDTFRVADVAVSLGGEP